MRLEGGPRSVHEGGFNLGHLELYFKEVGKLSREGAFTRKFRSGGGQ